MDDVIRRDSVYPTPNHSWKKYVQQINVYSGCKIEMRHLNIPPLPLQFE